MKTPLSIVMRSRHNGTGGTPSLGRYSAQNEAGGAVTFEQCQLDIEFTVGFISIKRLSAEAVMDGPATAVEGT